MKVVAVLPKTEKKLWKLFEMDNSVTFIVQQWYCKDFFSSKFYRGTSKLQSYGNRIDALELLLFTFISSNAQECKIKE